MAATQNVSQYSDDRNFRTIITPRQGVVTSESKSNAVTLFLKTALVRIGEGLGSLVLVMD